MNSLMGRAVLLSPVVLLFAAFSGFAVAEDPKGASRGPLVAYAWSGEARDSVVPMYWVTAGRDLPDASRAKTATDSMPEGHRVLFLWSDVLRTIDHHPDDCCRDAAGQLTKVRGIWWDAGVAETAERLDRWFSEYRRLGGRVDTVVIDFESNFSNWALGNNAERCQAIERDPRFAAIADRLDLNDLTAVRNWRGGDAHQKWNALMEFRQAEYLNRAVSEPIRRHYPKVRLSNYGYGYNKRPFASPDRNGYEHSRFETDLHVGTHQSAPLYGWLGSVRHSRVQGTELARGGEGPAYGHSPFAAFRLAVNQMRSLKLSSQVPVMPWLSHKRFAESLLRDGDLYQELILHTALTGPDAVLFWNPRPHLKQHDPDHFTSPEQDQLISDCLREFNSLVRAEPRRTCVDRLAAWGDDYVLSGMTVGNQTLWRFTPDPDGAGQINASVMQKVPAVIRTKSATITVPGSRIHEVASPVSDAGVWVLAPLDSRPLQSVNTPR